MKGTCCVLVVACAAALSGCQNGREPAPAAKPNPASASNEDWSLSGTRPAPSSAVAVDKTAIAAARTDWPAVVAQLTEFRRTGNSLTARLLLRNEGVETQRPSFTFDDVHLVDSTTGKTYDVLKEQSYQGRFFADLDPGGRATVAITFAAPPPEVKIVALQIPNISPFEHLSIQDQ